MKNKTNKKILSVVLNCILHNILLVSGLVLSIAGSVAFAIIPPLVLEKIVNRLASGTEIKLIYAVWYFLCLMASGVFDSLKETMITVFGQKITIGFRREMCAKLSKLPAFYFTKNQPGVTVSRFVGDVDTVEALFASGVVGMFVDICKIIGIMSVIFIKSLGLGIIMCFIAPLLFYFTRVVQKKMLSAQIKNRESVGRINGIIPETIRNIRTIHVFHREKYMEQKYDKMIKNSYNAVEKANFYDAVYSPVIIICSSLIIALMMVLAATGGRMQTFFGISVGTAVAVIAYVGKIFDPLENIGMEIQTIQSASAGVHRISEFLNQPERKETDKNIDTDELISSSQPAVSLSNVCFGYDDGVPVLKNISFKIERGESVTLSGRTGCGKSTVIRLLLGLYSPQSGCAKIFGKECSKIPDSCKRKIFGYVDQSFYHVPGTIADQIAVFDKNITPEDIQNAAKTAGIHQTICSLPDGYMTVYSETLFSQGQKQLLAIARALAADPMILLLDEITADLDCETEKRVLAALKAASEKRTVISVSHRLYEKTGGRIIEM